MCLPKSPVVIVCCFIVLNHIRRSSDLFSSKITATKWHQLNKIWGLQWWINGKESVGQRRRHGFNPWPGRTAHAAEHRSLCITAIESVLQSLGAATTDARLPRAVLLNKRSLGNEKPMHHTWRVAPAHHNQRKSLHSNEDPAQPIPTK